MRNLYITEALNYIPHILELLDRSPVSKTFGCFDREYWHYKAKDFPSGMYEECVLTLALIYKHDFDGNIYFSNPRIKEFIEAGINFAIKSSHSNGSNDDYYPNEQALGSTSFSLYALTESYLLLGLNDKDVENFFKKRADFIINKNESGTLSNHHALAAMALHNLFLITNNTQFKEQAEEKIKETLSYQSEEGWFKEYGGCDPGYLTFTIDFLAKYLQKNPDHAEVKSALKKAVNFCFITVHPDGSYGGEYGSRNTSHFLPNGFEILANHFPEAGYIRDKFLKSLQLKTRSRIDDDRIFNHYVYNYIQAFLNHNDSISVPEQPSEHEHLFKDAGIYVRSKDNTFLICSIKKGGVFKFYRNGILIASDCGFVLENKNGEKIISQMLVENPDFNLSDDSLTIKSGFYKYSQILPTPAKQLIFRIATLLGGSTLSRVIRVILQKILITSKNPVQVKLERKFTFSPKDIEITDTIITKNNDKFTKLYIPTEFTPIYVATGQSYNSSTLMPWLDYGYETETLNKNKEITITRKF